MAPRKKQFSDVLRQITDEDGRLRYANPDDEFDPTDPPDEEMPIDLDGFRSLTANQLVAFNVARARRSRGWSQEWLGKQLERMTGRIWSKASVSAAESSWRGGRVRKFDANEVLAFAVVFNLPIAYFFSPPDDPSLEGAYVFADVFGDVGIPAVATTELVGLVDPRGGASLQAEFLDRLGRGDAADSDMAELASPKSVATLLRLIREAEAREASTAEETNDE